MSWLHNADGREWFVYVLHEEGAPEGPVKVGTARNASYRVAGMQNGNWRRLVIFAAYPCRGRSDALNIEKRVQAAYEDPRFPGRDWLRMPAKTVADLIGALAWEVRSK